MYPLRKCKNPSGRPCLYYHMGQCLACSETPPSKETYKEIVQNMTSFLQGGYQDTKKNLTKKMLEASHQLNFERAQELRDQIQHMEIIMEQQKMTLNDRIDRDVFGFSYDKGWMCIQVFFISQGKLIEKDVSVFTIYINSKYIFD